MRLDLFIPREFKRPPNLIVLETLTALGRHRVVGVHVEGSYAPGEKRVGGELSETDQVNEADGQGMLLALQDVLGEAAPTELRIAGTTRVITLEPA